MASDRALVVDWGTSSLRAWLVREGEVQELVRESVGVKDLGDRDQKRTFLQQVLGKHLEDIDTVEGIGMISSTLGIEETPYLTTPVTGDALLEARRGSDTILLTPKGRELRVRLGPGLASPEGKDPDRMRGEEVQALGATSDGVVVCPGSHSKWVGVADSTIMEFRTYLTGELYASLSQHTALAEAVSGGVRGSSAWADGFTAGLERSSDTFGRDLFTVRASWLGNRDSDYSSGLLSGLVIGLEWRNALKSLTPSVVSIVGNEHTGSLYRDAAEHFGIAHELMPDSIGAHFFMSSAPGKKVP
jgi:2-dehydro-3-deoxygalactonokinase